MVFIKKITQPGADQISTLNGKIDTEQGNNRIIGRDQNALPRLLILADGTEFRMKISQPDKNAMTASGDELIFDSNNNLFKIVDKGQITVIKPANQLNAQGGFAHNLPKAPIVVTFTQTSIDLLVSYNPTPDNRFSSDGRLTYQASVAVNAHAIDFLVSTPDVGSSPLRPYVIEVKTDFFYYIIQETAAPGA